MSKFKFEIQNPFIRKRIAFIGILHFTAGVFLAAAAAQQLSLSASKGFLYFVIGFGGLEVLLALLIRTIIKKTRWIHFTARFISVVAFFIIAFYYFQFMYPIYGIILVLMSLSYLGTTYMEHQMIRPFIVKFNNGDIAIPGPFSSKYYEWYRLSNVILKHTLLTIDFKSNQLFQAELVKEPPQEEQNAFNTFCQEQLDKVKD